MKKLLVMLALLAALPAGAAVTTIQVTIGSSATQVSTTPLYCSFAVFQNNNASDTVRLGDSTVSATRGILLAGGAPGGSFTTPTPAPSTSPVNLANWYVFGTNADTLDVTCNQVNTN